MRVVFLVDDFVDFLEGCFVSDFGDPFEVSLSFLPASFSAFFFFLAPAESRDSFDACFFNLLTSLVSFL